MDARIPVTSRILNQVSRADRFRGSWSSGAPISPDRLARLKETAHVQSVAAATRMAGIRVSDAEVVSILRGEATTVREAREILGYSWALDGPFPKGPLVTTEELRLLHATMLAGPGASPDPTPWREVPNHLEAFDSSGRAIGRIFQTLPPRLVPETMENLATWLEIGLRGGEHHPLLVIGAFILRVFTVSPFEKGNLRVSCLLTSHLLRRAGYDHLPYASLEREFEERREAFYDAFDTSSTKLWTEEADLESWLVFFLDCLVHQSERVAAKIDLERRALEFSPLQRAILETVREHGTARAALLLTATGTNRNTLKDNLRRLVDRGVLEQMGQRRGTLYRLATGEPLAKIKDGGETP